MFANDEDPPEPMLSLGQVVATPAALAALQDSDQSPTRFLRRHVVGDWGDVSPEDARLNDRALKVGSRILSAYTTTKGVKLWVITEASDEYGQRTATTLLLPAEY